MKVIIVSGGFDPIHSGHIEYLNAAKALGDHLIVALNSDKWLERKKGKPFMNFVERKFILESLRMVDEVIDFEDDENGSAILGIEKIKILYPNHKIIFCNGGDRNINNILEMEVQNIEFVFGVGGDNKRNSSSTILKNSKFNKETRIWGEFYDLFIDKGVKLKELVIKQGKKMSFQRHFYRNEIWFISKGKCIVKFQNKKMKDYKQIYLQHEDIFNVYKGDWHQIINPYDEPCHIIEIQYGEKTLEDDIERK